MSKYLLKANCITCGIYDFKASAGLTNEVFTKELLENNSSNINNNILGEDFANMHLYSKCNRINNKAFKTVMQ